jgi:fumarate reductase flavoprotein subunit
MATEIGAANEGLGILQIGGPAVAGSLKLRRLFAEPRTLWMNKRGERYTDESKALIECEVINAVLRQPGKLNYTLLDEELKLWILEDVNMHGTGFIQDISANELEAYLRLQAKSGHVKIANSWSEIARWMGAIPDVLTSAVEEYNSFCDRGHDALFTKEQRYLTPLRTPPFYAIRTSPVWIGTIGGIKINERMEVLNKHGKPIKGLYAGGVDTGGWESETYNLILSGSTFGFAINSGRIAAEQAVDYVLTGR